jgi:hypothetical protein
MHQIKEMNGNGHMCAAAEAALALNSSSHDCVYMWSSQSGSGRINLR